MAGRGRGGKTGSLTQEQLQSLGCVGKDLPQVQTAPPPTYPQLMWKPVAQETSVGQKFQILWKEDFLYYMQESPYFIQPVRSISLFSAPQNTNINTYKSNSRRANYDFNWSVMPAELQMISRKRKAVVRKTQINSLTAKTKDIENRLKLLEEKERTDNAAEAAAKGNSDSEQEGDEEEEVVDDEMDDENDYGNSYFDNGESYNDEDDNLDDGPVY